MWNWEWPAGRERSVNALLGRVEPTGQVLHDSVLGKREGLLQLEQPRGG